MTHARWSIWSPCSTVNETTRRLVRHDERETKMTPSMNMVLLVGEVTHNFAPRSERGPALLKVKTERNGYGDKAGEVFADYVGVTCFGRARDRCAPIKPGDVVRVTGTVSERKHDDVWKMQVVADEAPDYPAQNNAPRTPVGNPYADSTGVEVPESEIPF